MVEKIGPYRVYERLGVGGMGEVYKAYDDSLDRWVAIKRIRPDREDADDNRERFKREARATARLNHPSIVHLYGIFQDGDSDCIVMEYVEGETLDKKLVNGPLEPLESATLGHEIASGLAEAHANGILHRDLKAENIIITPKGRSKILDFGLAKPILAGELDPVLTGKGQLVGTSRAMSPEYVGGEEIDHRSDLFALGVLIYECLTGQSPFKAHNTLATLKQVMLHKQTPIREINPNVPPALSRLIDRLLAKDPSERPQSAQDVAISFGELCGKMSSSSHERPTGSFLDSTSSVVKKQAAKAFAASETVLDLRPPRRMMTGLIVLGVLLIGAFFLGRFLNRPPEVEPLPEGEQIRVVLGDFVNNTEEPVFDVGLQQAMRVDLEQSRFIRTLSPSVIRDTLARMELASEAKVGREVALEIARREGAQRVVLGELQKFGGTYSLLMQVVAPENDVTTFSASESANNHEGILSAMQGLTKAVRRHLGESADQISQSTQALEKVTTANFDALRAYTLGEQRFSRGHYEEAITLYKRALELDSSFGMAHAKLVMAFSALGKPEMATQQALEAQKHSDRLAEAERFYIDGWVARWLGTPQDVIEVWSLFRDLHPMEFSGHKNTGLSYLYFRNDFEMAEKAFESATKVAQSPLEEEEANWCLGISRLALGKLSGAEKALTAGGEGGIEGLVLLRLVEGKFDEAQSQASLLSEEDNRLRAEQLIQVSTGSFGEALRTIVTSRQRAQNEGLALTTALEMHFAVTELALLSQLGRGDEIPAAVGRIESLARQIEPYSREPDNRSAPMVAAAIKILARGGRLEAAARLRGVLGDPAPNAQAVIRSLMHVADAELALARGDLDSAERLLAKSIGEVDMLSTHESLGVLFQRKGELSAAAREYSWVSDHIGLAYTECYLSCSSIPNTVMMWAHSTFRLARLLEQAGDPDGANEAYSLFLDRWGDAQMAEVALARQRVGDVSP